MLVETRTEQILRESVAACHHCGGDVALTGCAAQATGVFLRALLDDDLMHRFDR
jgi:hypothetical protein